MATFEQTYVSTNNRIGTPDYDPDFLEKQHEVLTAVEELKPISYAILASLSIGVHRPDLVPRLFDTSISKVTDEEIIKTYFNQFRSVLMIVWPFVGIPWCVPACLGLVNVLKSRGLEEIAEGRTLPDLDPESKGKGAELLKKTYNGVQNSEVQGMLRTYFSDFSSLTWTVVFGYSMAETTATGIFKDYQTQLVLAAAIAASGATRQARSHGKAAIGMGNSTEAVKKVYKVAQEINQWNLSSVAEIDVDVLAEELKIALLK